MDETRTFGGASDEEERRFSRSSLWQRRAARVQRIVNIAHRLADAIGLQCVPCTCIQPHDDTLFILFIGQPRSLSLRIALRAASER